MPPSTGYANPTNAPTAIAQASYAIDLSDMPSEWWSAVDTSDGTKGRAFDSVSGNELACDWIDFDNGAETGILVFRDPTGAALSGDPDVYPPNTANASVAANATYGQYAAYDSSVEAYWPLHDANDRTSNGRNLTGQGGIGLGDVAGSLGSASNLNGADEYLTSTYAGITGTAARTISAMQRTAATGVGNTLLSYGEQNPPGTSGKNWAMSVESGVLWGRFYGNTVRGGSGLNNSAWHHVVMKQGASVSASGVNLMADGSGLSETASGSATLDTIATVPVKIGISSNDSAASYFTGDLQHILMESIQRSDAWNANWSSMLLDNSTYWGTWGWVEPTGSSLLLRRRNFARRAS